jgi:hypothetical protein
MPRRCATIAACMRRLVSYKLPKCVPAKADAAVQRQFIEQTLAPLMAAADSENPLYFVNATHPSCTSHPSHGWIRRGETRELKSNHGRVNITINGALRWHGLLDIHSHPSAEPFSVSWARIRWQRPTLLGRTRGAG